MERPNPSARWDSPMIHCRLGEDFPMDDLCKLVQDGKKPRDPVSTKAVSGIILFFLIILLGNHLWRKLYIRIGQVLPGSNKLYLSQAVRSVSRRCTCRLAWLYQEVQGTQNSVTCWTKEIQERFFKSEQATSSQIKGQIRRLFPRILERLNVVFESRLIN